MLLYDEGKVVSERSKRCQASLVQRLSCIWHGTLCMIFVLLRCETLPLATVFGIGVALEWHCTSEAKSE